MEELAELHFELSSPVRLTLLSELGLGEMKLTRLAEKLNASVQQTSKHMGRLKDAGLIEKRSNGAYRLTSYGNLTLDLLPSFRFLSKNKEYLLTHDLSFLSQEFVQRVGELSENEYAEHVSGVLEFVDQVIREAEQFIWIMSDQCPVYDHSVNHPEKLSVRCLQTSIKREEYQWAKNMFGDRFEPKYEDDIKISIVLNEKIAGVCFPDLNGKIDFSLGFRSSNPRFHQWCCDVFTYHWERAKTWSPAQLQSVTADSLTARV